MRPRPSWLRPMGGRSSSSDITGRASRHKWETVLGDIWMEAWRAQTNTGVDEALPWRRFKKKNKKLMNGLLLAGLAAADGKG